MRKKKTTQRRKLLYTAPPVPEQIGRALVQNNLGLLRVLIECNGTIRDMQKVWKFFGISFDQAVGGNEFYEIDADAYGPAENECGEERRHTDTADAIACFREASNRLLADINLFIKITDSCPLVILRARSATGLQDLKRKQIKAITRTQKSDASSIPNKRGMARRAKRQGAHRLRQQLNQDAEDQTT